MEKKTHLLLLTVLPLMAILFYLIREGQVAGVFGFPLDDSWIFWVFARNLATGQGFSFNPGQTILGTTSILWVLVLSGSYLITQSVVFISKFWGVFFFLAAIFLTYRICLFHTGNSKVAFFGVMTFAFAPAMIFGALSGMEISLATFLFCLTLYFHLRERGRNKGLFLSPIFGGICFVARPELFIFYPLLLVHDYIRAGKGSGQTDGGVIRKTIFRKFIVFVVFLGFPVILSLVLTGKFLPNTLAAKALDSGLLWAIEHGNLNELLISLTLNPVIWGGTILIVMIRLNAFWALFWIRGLVLSFLNWDTFVYPLIFLSIPMVRGMVAPVGNSLYGEHRYVSFLFPLLAVFFVIGWEGFRAVKKEEKWKSPLLKWLPYVGALGLVSTLILYLNPLVQKNEILRFLSGYYFPSVLNFANFKLVFSFMIVLIAGVNILFGIKFFVKSATARKVLLLPILAGVLLQIGFLVNRAQHHALSVKNINEMQVHLGKWMDQNIPENSLVAINDVGAIKFFGKRQCLDLEGLVSPQIIPYKILGLNSYALFFNRNRPDYFITFPVWYPEIYEYLGLWGNVLYEVKIRDNVACGGIQTVVAKPDWDIFENVFGGSGLLEMKPYLPRKSFRHRWDDALERQILPSDWRVYQLKGVEKWRKHDWEGAERFYLKAESCQPETDEFYIHLSEFYDGMGDGARAEESFRKALKYRLFPPPDYTPPGKR